jgi:DNA-binding NtrC family response regulator
MAEKPNIVVVDDEAFSRSFLETVLKDNGYGCLSLDTAAAFREYLKNHDQPNLVLLDVRLPDDNGLKVLERLRAKGFDAPVIIITAYGSIKDAVKAMKLGAFDFFTKPFEDTHKIVVSIRNALERSRLVDENRRLKDQLQNHRVLDDIVGESKAMQTVFELIRKAAKVNSHILIEGESGTGKELVAEAVHQLSDRRNRPFIPVNCAALPESLLESVLFGYEKGAYTGAVKTTPGFFEEAGGGTLLLDEIGETPLPMQAKILRVVEESAVYRVGSTKPITIDARLVFATNKDLGREASQGRFRRDLYFRINIIKIQLPPLRRRKGDIPLLVNHFLTKYCQDANLPRKHLTNQAIQYLWEKDWPGNVRELKNNMERIVALHPNEEVAVDDLRRYSEESWDIEGPELFEASFDQAKSNFEKAYFSKLLDRAGGDLNLAAEMSGMHLATIYRKLKSLNISQS